MSNKSTTLFQSTQVKIFSSPKASNAFYPTLSSSTSRFIRNARASYKLRLIPPKRTNRPGAKLLVEIRPPSPVYHPWDSKYCKILTREKVKKPMAKNPYQQKRQSFAHATEAIVTEEECCPLLITSDAVQILKPLVHQELERPTPDSVRYIRANELMPSERSTVTKSSKASTPSLILSSTKGSRPTTKGSQVKSTAPVLGTAARLLNRARFRDAPVVIRRPPRRLIINVVRETVMPLAVYG